MCRTGPARRGFTLAEALLASTILAATVTAVSLPFTVGAQNEQDGARLTLAVGLAEELMEEILAAPFDDPNGTQSPGPGADETSRPLYDCMDDYHGYHEAAGQIVDYHGVVAADPLARDLSRSATVEYVYLPGQDTTLSPTVMRITVAVAYKGVPVVTLQRLAYRYSP